MWASLAKTGSHALLTRNSKPVVTPGFPAGGVVLFRYFSAEGAVDHAVIAAHRKRHAMAHDDLVAIVHYRGPS